jgi:hypothetical protein
VRRDIASLLAEAWRRIAAEARRAGVLGRLRRSVRATLEQADGAARGERETSLRRSGASWGSGRQRRWSSPGTSRSPTRRRLRPSWRAAAPARPRGSSPRPPRRRGRRAPPGSARRDR